MRKIYGLAMVAICGAAHAQQVQPGLWETSSKVTSMVSPGMPPNVSAMMAGRPATVSRQCVRPADAAKGYGEMLKNGNRDCTVQSSRFAGGVLDVQTLCKADGQVSAMHMHGPYSPTAYTLTSETTTNGGGNAMRMTMQVSGKRIGPCS